MQPIDDNDRYDGRDGKNFLRFLREIGVYEMPEPQIERFKDLFHVQLESSVGFVLSQGISSEDLSVFEAFTNYDVLKITSWIDQYAPDYEQDWLYNKLRRDREERNGQVDELALLAEYAQTKWLTIHRGDYKDVVAQVYSVFKSIATEHSAQLIEALSFDDEKAVERFSLLSKGLRQSAPELFSTQSAQPS